MKLIRPSIATGQAVPAIADTTGATTAVVLALPPCEQGKV